MSKVLLRCHRCRHSIIDTFAAIAGVSIKSPSLTNQPTNLRQTTRIISRRPITISARTQIDEQEPSSKTITDSNSSSSIPWYLQVETPDLPAPTTPHLALQEIPPIPSDAPQILSPILNHLSVHIGLDNLALIDLRHLDPPPALGANLIMIIGTARSYKHLNTSADRFCRWIRSRYKLAPYADGLLGRNEMKLKLRRKARKIKLAQSVGNTVAMNNADDGITTGWICVNLGNVENARIPEEEVIESASSADLTPSQQEELASGEEEYENPEQTEEGYSGFGSRSLAPRIVVQMFTDEKRLEMDLEGLWDFRNERRAQKARKAHTEGKQYIEVPDGEDSSRKAEPTFKPWSQ